jgi:hypothetical protein
MDNRMLELLWLVDQQLDIACLIKAALASGDFVEVKRLVWSWKFIDMRIKAVA